MAVANAKKEGQLIHLGVEGPLFIAMLEEMSGHALLDRVVEISRSEIVDLVQFFSQSLSSGLEKSRVQQEAVLEMLSREVNPDRQ